MRAHDRIDHDRRCASPTAGVARRSAAPPTRTRGFTLLELIVVIAIFAVFSLMAYGGLDSVLKTRRQVELAQDRIAQLQKAYLRLRNDLQQVRDRPARDGFGDVQPALRADGAGYLEFTRAGWTNPLYLPRAGLERVAYRFEEGKLIRASWRVLDRAQDSVPVEAVLLDELEDVRWRYLDAVREWRDSWPIPAPDQVDADVPPPLAVEVTLEPRDLGEVTLLFRLGSVRPPLGSEDSPPPLVTGGVPSADPQPTANPDDTQP